MDLSSTSDGYPIVELDSDFERGESSDDDIAVVLHGTPEQKRRLQRRSRRQRRDGNESSSESEEGDDFEKEMAVELHTRVKQIERKHNYVTGAVAAVSNDELLYDPAIDDDNQKWVDAQRRTYQPAVRAAPARGATGGAQDAAKRLPNSDAVLNCPGCMTLLCLDCQRHSTHQNQYRAMFVINCGVDRSEILHMKPMKEKKSRRRQAKFVTDPSSESGDTGGATYHPVNCTVCNTEVAVFDKEDIFHFFNVLSSYT